MRYRCQHRLRVRWSEVDAQKIVFNGHYLTYVDTAVTEYWRALGLPFQQVLPRYGGDVFLRSATLDYRASARYDDWVDVGVRCERLGRSSLTMDCGLFARSRQLLSVQLVYVYADPAAGRSMEWPQGLRDWILAYEAGENMLAVELGPWSLLGSAAAALRREVFIAEQGVPEADEWDEADGASLHAIARNRLGDVVATARLLPAVDGQSRIGRMAVIQALRGAGFGHQLLSTLLQAARDRGDRCVLIHAQTAVQSFYLRAGFVAEGSPFVEAGIEHVVMRKRLDPD